MFLTGAVFIALYCFAIACLVYGFHQIKPFEISKEEPQTRFSIVVPFRNESHNLPHLLESFSKLNYPKSLFEVILVDDDSTDNFQLKDYDFQVSIIPNIRRSDSPKKDAINTAVDFSKNEWIVTTDADCEVSPNWLTVLDQFIQANKVEMVAGTVVYKSKNSFLHQFQQLDMMSLQGATIGSFGIDRGFMCNGANFAYSKAFFRQMKGFDGNDKIASGDDVFLLQKAIAQFPEKVSYLLSKEHVVITPAVNDWKTLFFQRVRWASKTTHYQSLFGKQLGLIVFGANFALIVMGIGILLRFVPATELLFLTAAKILFDYVLLRKIYLALTNQTMLYFFMGSLFYPLFSSSVALYSLFGNYQWKGRSFRK